MKVISTVSVITLFTLITIYCSISNANEAFVGIGVANEDQDDANSVNLSVTAGYDFYNRHFQSSIFQRLTLAVETSYSQSISGTNETKNYSLFGSAKLFTSAHYYLKLKQGVTRFPDVKIADSNDERSHMGLGIGLGYKLKANAIEVEYVYSNKTLHASVIAINYKYHF